MIILTGASSGLGQEIIKDLSKIDFVYAIYNKNKPKISNIRNIKLVKLNLTDEKKIIKFVNGLKESNIVLIHLAAYYKELILANMSVTDYDNHYQINQKAIFVLNKYVIPKMVYNKWGRIIMFSSPAAEKGHPGTSAYSATKSSLIGLSKVISNEYARFNITSNVVVAGYFDFGIYKSLTEVTKIKLVESIPSKKLGDIKSLVNAINFIIKSDFVNGSVINVDGGV